MGLGGEDGDEEASCRGHYEQDSVVMGSGSPESLHGALVRKRLSLGSVCS